MFRSWVSRVIVSAQNPNIGQTELWHRHQLWSISQSSLFWPSDLYVSIGPVNLYCDLWPWGVISWTRAGHRCRPQGRWSLPSAPGPCSVLPGSGFSSEPSAEPSRAQSCSSDLHAGRWRSRDKDTRRRRCTEETCRGLGWFWRRRSGNQTWYRNCQPITACLSVLWIFVEMLQWDMKHETELRSSQFISPEFCFIFHLHFI